jgi:chloramphenicol O-acetyltransferase type A
MRYIDLETWPRRDHFRFFNGFGYPHFSLCANVDVTAYYPFIKQRGVSFTVATAYVIARAANAIPEFRYRIRGETVVEHEIVHPSTTIMVSDDLFSFCTIKYTEAFSQFATRAAEQIANVRENLTLTDEPGQDNLLYMTPIPWVSFTGLMHPLQLNPTDSVPRFAWGKFFTEGDSLKMPLSVQGHHAVMDGLHAGRFYAEVQTTLSDPGSVLGAA